MICEHEIPQGSRLYFGNVAKAKRLLENKVSEIFMTNNFEEIVTPNFSFTQHQSINDETKLINTFDQDNTNLNLRADSTLDVVRIITKRLGRTTSHKKWFYIQPVFTYPSTENYQMGCEYIAHENINDIIDVTTQVLEELQINPVLQISNINIPRLLSTLLNIEESLFKDGEIAAVYALKIDWLTQLLEVIHVEDLEKLLSNKDMPNEILEELKILHKTVKNTPYNNIVVAPLYYDSLQYYDGIYYRVIQDNLTIAKGGSYHSEGLNSLGFALYTDNLLKVLED
ncbi:MAG: ATP phosphoribosyltransferase regulatory subunit [Campylobacterota bacterium]|nr:ATP phosphoribosyltransferase regulatory subunit [Campylobacterota bacterium]